MKYPHPPDGSFDPPHNPMNSNNPLDPYNPLQPQDPDPSRISIDKFLSQYTVNESDDVVSLLHRTPQAVRGFPHPVNRTPPPAKKFPQVNRPLPLRPPNTFGHGSNSYASYSRSSALPSSGFVNNNNPYPQGKVVVPGNGFVSINETHPQVNGSFAQTPTYGMGFGPGTPHSDGNHEIGGPAGPVQPYSVSDELDFWRVNHAPERLVMDVDNFLQSKKSYASDNGLSTYGTGFGAMTPGYNNSYGFGGRGGTVNQYAASNTLGSGNNVYGSGNEVMPSDKFKELIAYGNDIVTGSGHGLATGFGSHGGPQGFRSAATPGPRVVAATNQYPPGISRNTSGYFSVPRGLSTMPSPGNGVTGFNNPYTSGYSMSSSRPGKFGNSNPSNIANEFSNPSTASSSGPQYQFGTGKNFDLGSPILANLTQPLNNDQLVLRHLLSLHSSFAPGGGFVHGNGIPSYGNPVGAGHVINQPALMPVNTQIVPTIPLLPSAPSNLNVNLGPQFHCFPRLLPELKFMVWDWYMIANRRFVTLKGGKSDSNEYRRKWQGAQNEILHWCDKESIMSTFGYRYPAILHVDRLARERALLKYEKVIINPFTNQGLWLNLEIDYINFHDQNTLVLFMESCCVANVLDDNGVWTTI